MSRMRRKKMQIFVILFSSLALANGLTTTVGPTEEPEPVSCIDEPIEPTTVTTIETPERGTKIIQNNQIDKISILYKHWELTVDIKPTGLVSGWGNIVHVGIGRDSSNYGDRTPGIWFHSDSTRLHIASAINGNRNAITDTDPIQMDEWSTVKISQTKRSDGDYDYKIFINGKIITRSVNTDARDFKNVQVMAGDNFYDPADARIDNLKIVTFPDDSKKSKCEKARKKASGQTGQEITGAFIPSCEPNGDYSAKQCNGSTGYCWCSTKTGKEIAGSAKGPGQTVTCEREPTDRITETYTTVEHYNYLEVGGPILSSLSAIQKGVKFSVVANNDIHISLSKNNPLTTASWEIVLGGWGGVKSVIRSSHQGENLATVKHSRAAFRKWQKKFELKVTDSSIGLYDENGDAIITYDKFDSTDINYLYISTGWSATGKWTVDKAIDHTPVDRGFEVSRNNQIDTIPTLFKQWKVSLDIKPTGTVHGWSNILHIGIGGDNDVYGDRTPGIWFHTGSTKLHMSSAINGNRNQIYDSEALPMDQWTTVEMSQLRRADGYYQFAISINDRVVNDLINTQPADFKNVKVYASDDYYSASKARIDNLQILNFPDGITEVYETSTAYNYMEVGGPILSYLKLIQRGVKFSVKAANDIHISLSKTNPITTDSWEIVLGGWSGTKSVIRKSHQGTNLVTVNHETHLYKQWQKNFELRVTDSTIGLLDENGDVIIEYDQFDSTDIRYLYISTGFGSTGKWTVNKQRELFNHDKNPKDLITQLSKRFGRFLDDNLSAHSNFVEKLKKKVEKISTRMLTKYGRLNEKCDLWSESDESDTLRYDEQNPCKAARQLTSVYIKWSSVYNVHCKKDNGAHRMPQIVERDFLNIEKKLKKKIGNC